MKLRDELTAKIADIKNGSGYYKPVTENNLSFYRLGIFDASKSNRRPIKILVSSVDKV